jgi:hypothetical protein
MPSKAHRSCLPSRIAASISVGVSLSSPRCFAPVEAFSSQSGGGAAVRIKSCTLMMTTAGSPRRSTMKRSLFLVARSMIRPNWVRAIWASHNVGQVVEQNPAAAVRGPKHVVKKGKTPVLDDDEAKKLIDSIDVSATGR